MEDQLSQLPLKKGLRKISGDHCDHLVGPTRGKPKVESGLLKWATSNSLRPRLATTKTRAALRPLAKSDSLLVA